MENAEEKRMNLNTHLPDEIMIQILSRLPVKSLLRSTSVCKFWYSLITNPIFIKTHLDFIISDHPNIPGSVLVMPVDRNIFRGNSYSISLISDTTFVVENKFDLQHYCPSFLSKIIKSSLCPFFYKVGSCNGLVLLADTRRNLYVFNPCLRNFVSVPGSESRYEIALETQKRISSLGLGFGFDKDSNDFKVVRIFYIRDNNSKLLGEVPRYVETYSLSTGKWKRIDANVPLIASDQMVVCNGYLNWYSRHDFVSSPPAILRFDISAEVFGEIVLPTELTDLMDDEDIDEETNVFLITFQGSLALFIDSIDELTPEDMMAYDIWVMKESDVIESWTKQFTILLPRAVSCVYGFTKSGKLILEDDNGKLASWCLEDGYKYLCGIKGNIVDVDFVESLFLLKGGNDDGKLACSFCGKQLKFLGGIDSNTVDADSGESLSSQDGGHIDADSTESLSSHEGGDDDEQPKGKLACSFCGALKFLRDINRNTADDVDSSESRSLNKGGEDDADFAKIVEKDILKSQK